MAEPGTTLIVEHYVADVLKESSTLNELQSRLHGLDHWWRVWKNAEWLTTRNVIKGVDLEVVALFALFHDSMRVNDQNDPGHPERGWFLFEYLYDGIGHVLTETQTSQLMTAICFHHEGRTHESPTVGVCWDADRMDIYRKGLWPDPQLMSTGAARIMALGRVVPDLSALRKTQLGE